MMCVHVCADDTSFRYWMNGLFAFWKTTDVGLDPSSEYQRLLKHKDLFLCNLDDSLPVCLATWAEHDFVAGQNKFHAKSAFLSFLDTIDMRHELADYIDHEWIFEPNPDLAHHGTRTFRRLAAPMHTAIL